MATYPDHQQHSKAQDSPESLLDALYCAEEHWEEQEGVVVDDDECGSISSTIIINTPPLLLEQDMFCDDEELTSLLSKEQRNPLCTCLESNPEMERVRREAVEWILRVNGFHSFSALTAVLAVNYFDRFLFSFRFENGKPWMTQLAAVACLSLAAKVEETQVPLLLDLQLQVEEDSGYLFEVKTIKRMEILVLSTLGWKMNPPTPISFLDYLARGFGLKDNNLCWELLNRCEGVLLSVIADSRFMGYLPSVLATATMMHVVNSVETHLGAECQNQLQGILGIDKDKVDDCLKHMLEVWSSGYEQGKQCEKKRKLIGSIIPSSPNGVMDVSFSCDSSSNDSWAMANSVSSSPEEPLSKKTRTQDQFLLNHYPNRPNSSNFHSIPH